MKILVILIILVVVLILFLYSYYGGFSKFKILTKITGGEIIVFETHIGDYKKSGEVSDKIYYSLLNDEKIETYKGIGIYYDNPKKTETEKLRSEIGCILEESDYDKIETLKEKYGIKKIEEKEYITSEFPFKGKLSILFGILKVIPALNEYAKENNYDEDSPIMEIYDVPNKKILYRKEIIKK